MQQHHFIELESDRALPPHLPHAIKPLQKNRRFLLIGFDAVVQPVGKFMTHVAPFFFDEDEEPVGGAIIRIQYDGGETRNLGSAVPAVAAVDECARSSSDTAYNL